MRLIERFPDLGTPILVYAPYRGCIGIFQVENLGNSLKTILLGVL